MNSLAWAVGTHMESGHLASYAHDWKRWQLGRDEPVSQWVVRPDGERLFVQLIRVEPITDGPGAVYDLALGNSCWSVVINEDIDVKPWTRHEEAA